MEPTPDPSQTSAWSDHLLRAASFLTRLPVPAPADAGPGSLARASWAFPVIGAGVGLGGGVVYALAAALGVPALAAALLAIAATLLLTGALHEDGLADTADGFGGGASVEAKLAIMRDSRSGAYGVLALVLSVGVRAAALAALGDGGRVVAALIAAHAVGRGLLPLLMCGLDPARGDGLGADAGRPEPAVAWGAAAIAAVVTLLALNLGCGLVALAVSGGVALLLAALARRQVGGYTGDVLGAIEQGGEIAMLLVAASWLS